MRPNELKAARLAIGLTQTQLAEHLGTTRMTITRYERGTHQIPGAVEVALKHLHRRTRITLAGTVAAGVPIEAIEQMEEIEVPPEMLGTGETFALRVKGESMIEDAILPGDIVILRKQSTAQNGQIVVALLNHDATIKRYYRKEQHIELHPANATMAPIVVYPHDHFSIEGVMVGLIRHIH